MSHDPGTIGHDAAAARRRTSRKAIC